MDESQAPTVSLKTTKEEEINHCLDELERLLHLCNPPEPLFRDTYRAICDARCYLFLCVHDGKFLE